jgi:hypothetical protein
MPTDKTETEQAIHSILIDRLWYMTRSNHLFTNRSKSSSINPRPNAKGQNVAKWEAEIDDRVARLYGLTPDEIKLIRGEG